MREVRRDSPFRYKAILTLSHRDRQTELERNEREKAEDAARKAGKTRSTPRSQSSGIRPGPTAPMTIQRFPATPQPEKSESSLCV